MGLFIISAHNYVKAWFADCALVITSLYGTLITHLIYKIKGPTALFLTTQKTITVKPINVNGLLHALMHFPRYIPDLYPT